MEEKNIYESQFHFIRSVIISADQVMYILKDNKLVNDRITDTIYLILEFTKKQIKTLPELLVYGENLHNPKDKLLMYIKKVEDIWLDTSRDGNELETTWYEFVDIWEKYEKLYNTMINSKNTIIMSLN